MINNIFFHVAFAQVKFNTPFPQRTVVVDGKNNHDGGKPSTSIPTTTMTTATNPQDSATVEMNEGEKIMHTGFLKEWTLMLHGTREPPYGQLSVHDPHSKLAIVKKAHTAAGPETVSKSSQKQSAY